MAYSMAKKAAIIRWTGSGRASDLESSIRRALVERKVRAEVRGIGGSIVVTGAEPLRVCSIFENMPGVAWTAAGYAADSMKGVARAATILAASYLKPGTTFSVRAEAVGRGRSSDLAGAVTSAVLEEVKGARASGEKSRVKFRAAVDGRKGVVGVEVAAGPGGRPMGEAQAVCLVSGGAHSSVLAWKTVLQGFRVHLVHAVAGEESLTAVGRLYAELSHRSDPRGLTLTALEGGPAEVLSKFIAGRKEPVYGGFTVGRPIPPSLARKVQAPLYMLPEEEFRSDFDKMGLRGVEGATDWGEGKTGAYSARTFQGRRVDVSGALDGLA